jgi:hypothetical protein
MCGLGWSKAGIKGEGLVIFVHSYPGFWVFANAISKKFVFPWRLIISIHSNGLPIL